MAAYLPLGKIVGFLFFFFLLVFTFSSWLQVVTVTCLQTTTVWLQSLSDRLLKVCKSLPTNFKMWTDCQRVAISQSQLAQHASLCNRRLNLKGCTLVFFSNLWASGLTCKLMWNSIWCNFCCVCRQQQICDSSSIYHS